MFRNYEWNRKYFSFNSNRSVLKSVIYLPIYITVLKPVFPYIDLDFGLHLGASVIVFPTSCLSKYANNINIRVSHLSSIGLAYYTLISVSLCDLTFLVFIFCLIFTTDRPSFVWLIISFRVPKVKYKGITVTLKLKIERPYS